MSAVVKVQTKNSIYELVTADAVATPTLYKRDPELRDAWEIIFHTVQHWAISYMNGRMCLVVSGENPTINGSRAGTIVTSEVAHVSCLIK